MKLLKSQKSSISIFPVLREPKNTAEMEPSEKMCESITYLELTCVTCDAFMTNAQDFQIFISIFDVAPVLLPDYFQFPDYLNP